MFLGTLYIQFFTPNRVWSLESQVIPMDLLSDQERLQLEKGLKSEYVKFSGSCCQVTFPELAKQTENLNMP